MSDYLWDKTGEPDEAVERLEGLLGELKYKRRALELPLDSSPARARVQAPAARPRLPLRSFGLAAAAVLLLALVAVAFVMLRPNLKGSGEESARRPVEIRREDRPSDDAPQPTSPPGRESASDQAPVQESAAGARKPVAGVEQVADGKLRRERRKGRELAVEGRTTPRQREQSTSAAPVGGVNGLALASSPSGSEGADLKTRLAAKEQLLFALRLTGSKLREVQEKTQANGLKQSFAGPKKIQ